MKTFFQVFLYLNVCCVSLFFIIWLVTSTSFLEPVASAKEPTNTPPVNPSANTSLTIPPASASALPPGKKNEANSLEKDEVSSIPQKDGAIPSPSAVDSTAPIPPPPAVDNTAPIPLLLLR